MLKMFFFVLSYFYVLYFKLHVGLYYYSRKFQRFNLINLIIHVSFVYLHFRIIERAISYICNINRVILTSSSYYLNYYILLKLLKSNSVSFIFRRIIYSLKTRCEQRMFNKKLSLIHLKETMLYKYILFYLILLHYFCASCVYYGNFNFFFFFNFPSRVFCPALFFSVPNTIQK
jgi:hypothetical protein